MMMMMLPEELLVAAFDTAGVPAYTTLDSWGTADEVVVIVRSNYSRDLNRMSETFKDRHYSFTLQCFSKNGKKAVAVLVEQVSDIVDDLFIDPNVASVEVVGSNLLPRMNGYDGQSIGINLSLTD